jgi:hypothetical protein
VAGRLGKLLPIGTLGPATGRDKSAPTHLQPPYPQKSRDTAGQRIGKSACHTSIGALYSHGREFYKEPAQMNKDDIEKYLRMLGRELLTKQVTGELLLVGGAVMLLEIGNREITKDIDAYFDPQSATAIREASIIIARREGLPVDWLTMW